jgi:hypothetical protein
MKTPINNNIDQLFNKAKADKQDLDDFEKEAMAGFDMLESKEEVNELKAALDERINNELFYKKENHNPKVYWLAAAGLALIIGLSTLFILNDSNSISKNNGLAITDTKKETLPETGKELKEQASAPLETLSPSEKEPAKDIAEKEKSEQKIVSYNENAKTASGPTSRMVISPANGQAASVIARSENHKEGKKQETNFDGEGIASSADQTVKLDDLAKTIGSKDKESDAFKAIPSSVQQSPNLAESEAIAKDEIALENKNTKGKNDSNQPNADSKKSLNQVASNNIVGGVTKREESVAKEKSKKARAKSNSTIAAAPESDDNKPGAPVTTKSAEEATTATPSHDKREDNNFINCYYTGGEGAIIKDIKEKLVAENLDKKFDVTLYINEKKTVTKVDFTNSNDLTKKQKEDVTKVLKTLNKFNFFVSPTKKGEFTYKVAYRP